MTDEQLRELTALAEAATPGPWWVDQYATDMSCTEHAVGIRTDDMVLASMGIDDVAMPDARFIAAARDAVPELLAEVSGLRRQLDRERIAAIQHAIWSHWMTYQFSVCLHNDDGTMTIPAQKVMRWERQAATPYAELPEAERESDRHQADKILKGANSPATREGE